MKKDIICYDLESTPKGVSLKSVLNLMEKKNILIYDSTLGGRPYMLSSDTEMTAKVVDVSQQKEADLIRKLNPVLDIINKSK